MTMRKARRAGAASRLCVWRADRNTDVSKVTAGCSAENEMDRVVRTVFDTKEVWQKMWERSHFKD